MSDGDMAPYAAFRLPRPSATEKGRWVSCNYDQSSLAISVPLTIYLCHIARTGRSPCTSRFFSSSALFPKRRRWEDLTMAEEQRFDEGHRLCVNNCGFLGSPATLDLCSKCYRDLRLKEDHAGAANVAIERSISPPPSASASTLSFCSPYAASSLPYGGGPWGTATGPSVAAVDTARRPSRCLSCRKKVGLMGFRCRCGETFCGEHRYPELHSCIFDYKATGRDSIARANPLVKADKLRKI